MLKDKNNHFNIANLFTLGNISMGTLSLILIFQEQFIWACVCAWLGGFLDIFDGKMARKYNLSTQFGVQLDSYADLLTFVIVPMVLLYNFTLKQEEGLFINILIAVVIIYYIISGIRRLITFNLNANEGEVEKYFIGFPTPLGAICLFVLFYMNYVSNNDLNVYITLLFIAIVGFMLNSKVKVRHP